MHSNPGRFLCNNLSSAKSALEHFVEEHVESAEATEPWIMWLVGLAMVTVTAFSASIGILLIPNVHGKSRILTLMSGLGGGALIGTALYVMFPEAFRITQFGPFDYTYKSTLVVAGIYMLLLVDRLIKLFFEYRKLQHYKKPHALSNGGSPMELSAFNKDELKMSISSLDSRKKFTGKEHREMTTKSRSKQNPMAELALAARDSDLDEVFSEETAQMVIFSNLLINFIDGLCMGVAFKESLVRGLTVSSTIAVQQFPQEVADLAIVIELGMSRSHALLYNLVPALLSYLGFAIGAGLGHVLSTFDDSVFAVTGGMYLYISLSLLLPEMTSKIVEMLKANALKEALITAVLQIVGIVLGLVFIFHMSILSGDLIANWM